MANLPAAVVFMFAGGYFFAVLVPRAIRSARGSVFEKTLTGVSVFGAACAMLGAGGLATFVLGAPTVAHRFAVAALISAGVSLLAVTTRGIWRGVVVKRNTPAR